MKVVHTLVIVALAVLMASCCACRMKSSDPLNTFVGHEWKLIQKGDEVMPARETENYRVTFMWDKNVYGVGDCNRFSGSFTYSAVKKPTTIDIGQLATTRMGCPNPAGETEFIQFLQKADRYDVDGDLLILQVSGQSKDSGRWVFEKVKPVK